LLNEIIELKMNTRQMLSAGYFAANWKLHIGEKAVTIRKNHSYEDEDT